MMTFIGVLFILSDKVIQLFIVHVCCDEVPEEKISSLKILIITVLKQILCIIGIYDYYNTSTSFVLLIS